ncbi:MAG TPA: ribonuclease HI [Fibrobacteria bacterium]|nr:ribonuclease HI [Fibrobacteria bacterium]
MDGSDSITIYTDGGCLGNPGPGGYGAVLLYRDHRKELSGGYRLTTNNRMELMGAIAALEALKARSKAVLHTDSQYVVNAMEKGWAQKWRRNGWRKPDKQPAMNPDLWERLLDLCSRHEVKFAWVRGHAGNVENERCDALANQAATRKDLPPDPGYGS